jgi:ACR3 family arsenite efflux pump ArsB
MQNQEKIQKMYTIERVLLLITVLIFFGFIIYLRFSNQISGEVYSDSFIAVLGTGLLIGILLRRKAKNKSKQTSALEKSIQKDGLCCFRFSFLHRTA